MIMIPKNIDLAMCILENSAIILYLFVLVASDFHTIEPEPRKTMKKISELACMQI